MNYQQQRADAFSDLLRRLGREAGLPSVTAAELGARAAASPLLAVLFTGDPTVSPESWDVAVVLPELLAACAGIAGCVLDPQQRFSHGRGPTRPEWRGRSIESADVGRQRCRQCRAAQTQ